MARWRFGDRIFTGAGFCAIIPPSHLFYYDRRTLGLAAAKSGFEVVETGFIAHLQAAGMMGVRG
jgi:hypothetical protein